MEHYERIYYAYQVAGRGITTPDELRAHFESASRQYDELVGPLLPADKTVPALDLACGYGNWLYFLQRKGYANCRGVDLDPQQVALARSIGLPAEIGDVSAAIPQASTLGLVSAFDLLEHLDKNTAVRLLEQIVHALRPGGMLVVRMPCADGFAGAHDMCNDLTHRWGASSNMLSQLLMTVGFASVRVVDLTLPPYPLGAKNRIKYAVRRVARAMLTLVLRVAGISTPRVWSSSQLVVAWKAPASDIAVR